MKKHTLKVAFINDMMGDDEAEKSNVLWSLEWAFEHLANDPVEVKVNLVAHEHFAHKLRDRDFDILVIDYGGMAVCGAHDGAVSHIRTVIELMQDRPSAFLLIFTPFTADLYEEAIEEFGELANVAMRSWDDEDHDYPWARSMRNWLGF